MIPMRNKILAGAAIIGLSVAALSCSSTKQGSSKRLPGTWQIEPVTIDGSNKDWPAPYPFYDDKAMLGYAISNDKTNLYITVETGDPATQLKILREGLTVWIDKTGKEDQVTAINYPLPNHVMIQSTAHDDRPAPGQWQEGHGGPADKKRLDLEDRVKLLLTGAKEYSLQGFKACNLQYPITETDSCGIMVRMSMDADNELIWEAVIPFRSFYHKRELTRSDNGKPMSICIETIGEKRPAGQRSGNSGGGNRSRGISPGFSVGGFGGMGMGMGFGGSRAPQRAGTPDNNILEPLYKSTATWKTFGIVHP